MIKIDIEEFISILLNASNEIIIEKSQIITDDISGIGSFSIDFETVARSIFDEISINVYKDKQLNVQLFLNNDRQLYINLKSFYIILSHLIIETNNQIIIPTEKFIQKYQNQILSLTSLMDCIKELYSQNYKRSLNLPQYYIPYLSDNKDISQSINQFMNWLFYDDICKSQSIIHQDLNYVFIKSLTLNDLTLGSLYDMLGFKLYDDQHIVDTIIPNINFIIIPGQMYVNTSSILTVFSTVSNILLMEPQTPRNKFIRKQFLKKYQQISRID